MNLEDTYQEISEIIQASISFTGHACSLSSDFGDQLDKASAIADTESRENLGLWIAILEQSIQWLSLFHELIGDSASKGLSERLVVPYTILSVSISQAVAIRKLCLIGLDTSARAVMRTLFESIDLAILTLFDFRAQDDFFDTEESEDARRFWNMYIRKKHDKQTGHYLSRVDEILQEVLHMSGHDKEHIDLLLRHHLNEIDFASRTVHLSLHAAQFTAKALSSDGHRLLPGRFGVSTMFSIRTLAQSSKWIWLFSRIAHPLLIDPIITGQESIYEIDVFRDTAKQERVAYYALNALLVSHWDDDSVSIN